MKIKSLIPLLSVAILVIAALACGGGTPPSEDVVNFQTSLSLEEAIEFYRQAFTGQGLTERKVLTVIEDEIFSMVFDGWPNNKALVIQGVDLGETTNINIRFEDV